MGIPLGAGPRLDPGMSTPFIVETSGLWIDCISPRGGGADGGALRRGDGAPAGGRPAGGRPGLLRLPTPRTAPRAVRNGTNESTSQNFASELLQGL